MRKTALVLLLTIFVSACATTSRSSESPSPLECWIASAGTPSSVYREGTFHVGGIDGTFRTWAAADGSYRTESVAGPYKEVIAVSGGKGWNRGGEGQPHELTGAELQAAISDAFLENPTAFRWTAAPGADPQTFVVTPAGGLPLTMRFEANRCAPVSVGRPQADRTMTTTVTGWTIAGSRSLPLELLQSTGDPKFDVRLLYTATRFGEPMERALFEPPKVEALVRLPEGKAFIEIPFELTQNHIYVPVSVNGQKPSSFVLDTGADFTVIEASHAKALGLEPKGSLEARGSGEASVPTGIIAGVKLGLGGLEFPLDAAFSIPLSPIWLREGRAMEGIIGYDVLSHFVFEVDYAARVVRLHDPARFQPPADAAAVPVTFDGNMPALETVVELQDGRRIPAKMSLDTGSRLALSLNRPYLEQHDILRSVGSTVRGPGGLGVGGATSQDIGRIAALHLGPHAVRLPIVSFSRDARGSDADPNMSGNIGGELLRRFTLWVDYPGARILLRPNAQSGEPFEYDMSGLLLETADVEFARVLVRNVLEGSAAAEGGIVVGDELLKVDGTPVGATTLEAVRKMLAQPGRRVVLTIVRDGQELEVTLTTRRMV